MIEAPYLGLVKPASGSFCLIKVLGCFLFFWIVFRGRLGWREALFQTETISASQWCSGNNFDTTYGTDLHCPWWSLFPFLSRFGFWSCSKSSHQNFAMCGDVIAVKYAKRVRGGFGGLGVCLWELALSKLHWVSGVVEDSLKYFRFWDLVSVVVEFAHGNQKTDSRRCVYVCQLCFLKISGGLRLSENLQGIWGS